MVELLLGYSKLDIYVCIRKIKCTLPADKALEMMNCIMKFNTTVYDKYTVILEYV